jgi:putative (di)nucleoside polyphosphate hydrolase
MILDEQDNILLGLSQYGYWQIPQGGIKKGESLEDATKREMLDEVGDNTMEVIEIIKNCYKYKWSKESRKGFEHIGQKQSLVIVRFTGDVKNLTPSPYEFKELQWVSKDDILEMVGDFKRDIIRIGLEKSTYFNT